MNNEANPPSSCLVLGTGVGYLSRHVRVFAQSLQRSGYKGRTVLITGELPDGEKKQMEQWGLSVIPASQFPGAYSRWTALKLMSPRARPLRGLYWLLRYLPASSAFRTRLLSRIGVHYHHIGCSRFMYYWDYLNQHPEVQKILLADVRDVFFQTDLFSEDWGPGLHVSLEEARGSIATGEYGNDDPTYDYRTPQGRLFHGINAFWIRTLYGSECVARIATKPICCAGVTYGDRASIMHYLKLMIRELTRHTVAINEGIGFDQGVHNVLLHSGRLPRAVIHENGAGPVFTVHAVPENELPLSPDHQILRRDGSPAAIVHQYDRSKTLNALMSL